MTLSYNIDASADYLPLNDDDDDDYYYYDVDDDDVDVGDDYADYDDDDDVDVDDFQYYAQAFVFSFHWPPLYPADDGDVLNSK